MAMLIHVATALTIVATDLLTGVLLGFALTLAQLAWQASRLKIGVVRDGRRVELRMGAATFFACRSSPAHCRACRRMPGCMYRWRTCATSITPAWSYWRNGSAPTRPAAHG